MTSVRLHIYASVISFHCKKTFLVTWEKSIFSVKSCASIRQTNHSQIAQSFRPTPCRKKKVTHRAAPAITLAQRSSGARQLIAARQINNRPFSTNYWFVCVWLPCRSGVGEPLAAAMGVYVAGAAGLAGLYAAVLGVGVWAAAAKRRKAPGGPSEMILANRNVGLFLGVFSLVGNARTRTFLFPYNCSACVSLAGSTVRVGLLYFIRVHARGVYPCELRMINFVVQLRIQLVFGKMLENEYLIMLYTDR